MESTDEKNEIDDSLESSEDLLDTSLPPTTPANLTTESKEEARIRKQAERTLKNQKREEARTQREILKLEKQEYQKKRAEARDEARKQREILQLEKQTQKRKQAEVREEAKRKRVEDISNRLCKGTCGKSRSRRPPKYEHRSRWFVCYGCKAYNLCLKCSVNRQLYTLFQEHAELCDPFYAERIANNTLPAPAPPPPPPAVFTPFTLQHEQDTGLIEGLVEYPSDNSDDDRDTLNQITVLPTQAQNLLNYYVPTQYTESTYKGCWTADSRLYKSDNSLVSACDIAPGDLLLGPNGSCSEVAAVIITSLLQKDGVKIVQLSKYCSLTSGHPVLDPSKGIYVRADSLKPSSKEMIEKLFNFELKSPCEGGGVICEGGVVAATVGKSFEEVRKYSKENDTMWGDDYWRTTRNLLQKNYWGNIKYITNSSALDR